VNERNLIVDDEPWVHEVARGYLEREGYIVYSATTKRPALLVWDLMLPDMSGSDLRRGAQPLGCRGPDADGEGE
jgi:CheY-like chemotaxis protein